MAHSHSWRSKLGNCYPRDQIQRDDVASQRALRNLRNLKERDNHLCADCGVPDNSWASVSLGVFICVTCSDVHRSVGTHVSKVKGCTGTYLWGPDELERMRTVGNRLAAELYGAAKVDPSAGKEERQGFVLRKYQDKAVAVPALPAETESVQPCQPSAREGPGSRRLRQEPAVTTKMPTRASGWAVQAATAGGAHKLPLARKADIPDTLFDALFSKQQEAVPPTVNPPSAKEAPGFGAAINTMALQAKPAGDGASVDRIAGATTDTAADLEAFLNFALWDRISVR